MKAYVVCTMLCWCACHTPAVPSKSAGNNVLSGQLPAANIPSTADTLQSPIDFRATGNEPFWLLEIDFTKYMHFKALSGFEITTPVPESAKAADANVTRYRAVTEQGELIVQIAKQECVNDMSGKKSAYRVSVDVKNSAENKYTSYSGCGDYLPDYRINDIWVLESINDTPLNKAAFNNGMPLLEFNLAQRNVFGSGGCNHFTGPAEVGGTTIGFGNLAGTLMNCPDMEFEKRYLQLLSGQNIPYFITPGKLHLQIGKDSVFTYKKTD